MKKTSFPTCTCSVHILHGSQAESGRGCETNTNYTYLHKLEKKATEKSAQALSTVPDTHSHKQSIHRTFGRMAAIRKKKSMSRNANDISFDVWGLLIFPFSVQPDIFFMAQYFMVWFWETSIERTMDNKYGSYFFSLVPEFHFGMSQIGVVNCFLFRLTAIAAHTASSHHLHMYAVRMRV